MMATNENIDITQDLPKLATLMKDMKTHCNKVSETVDRVIREITDDILDTSDGLSFLDVKCHLLLSYLINLTYVMLRKSKGEQLAGDNAIERIVEIRTVLEKIRPIEQKLKYQIDKLVKTATTGTVMENDPLQFTANPDNLIPKLNDEDGDSESEEGQEHSKKDESKSKVYVPPKMAAVHYDGDMTDGDRQKVAVEKARKRALSSSIMQELREEYYDGPEEISESRDVHRIKANKEANERKRYEEEYMVRVTVPKSKKNKARQMATMNNLKEITHFGDFDALMDDDDDHVEKDFSAQKRMKKQTGSKKWKKKGKSGFKKRK